MIIVSEAGPLEIGRTYRDKWLTDQHHVQHYNIPYTVLRVASEAEWERQCRDAGAKPINVTGSKLFYEISTD